MANVLRKMLAMAALALGVSLSLGTVSASASVPVSSHAGATVVAHGTSVECVSFDDFWW